MRKTLCLLLSVFMLVGLCNCAAASAPASGDYASTIDWAAEYDVVIAGYGAAGANAAITAADLGVKVLITEKAPQGKEGGGSKFSGQGIMATDDADELFYYIQGMRGLFGHTLSDEMIRAFADGAAQNQQWLLDLGANPDTMFAFRGTGIWNEYPELRGGEHCQCLVVAGTTFDGSYYYLLQDNVTKRSDNIDVWYDAPAVHLIQAPDTKVILGVQIAKDGAVYNVRAKNGVILATGGFEANMEMMANFLQQPYALVYAATYNTGDGIVMAQEVGAKLWHMSNSAGYIWGFLPPGAETCLSFGSAVRQPGSILVGPNGERFMNETAENRHGRIDVGGRWISMPMPLPTWLILDDAVVSTTKLHNSFSEGNVDEIEKGWILKADTIEELAELCAVAPEGLKETVAEWNEWCAAGEDGLYGRPADTMQPLNGPFYAMQLGPTMYNTQGGPERNANAEVLDLAGNPIPHLYSAGEMGAMWPDMYNGGGNLGEATIFGRIAGANAAKVKDDTEQGSLLNGKTPVNFANASAEVSAGENEYIGAATGMGGTLTVKVTMDGEKIASVEIVSQNETVGIGDRALEAIPSAIVEAQSADVDTVAGATLTSRAIIEAVKQALEQAAG